MTDERQRSGRLQFLLIAAVFFGPLLLAAWLYYQGDAVQPTGKTNHGTLLEPIVNLNDLAPDSAVLEPANWLLLYANAGSCNDECRTALHTLRQSRLMLGREMDRVTRVFLHGESLPDTLFLAEEHKGLNTAKDAELIDILDNKKPELLPAGGYYLIDPLGNLVMYFSPELEPGDMVDDVKRLLKLSHIG